MARGLAITTVGANVLWATETTAGTRPTSGYTILEGVNEAPAVELTTESLDVSDISDLITEYADGRQDTPGEISFTLNHRDEVISGWNSMASAYATASATGKALWIEYKYRNATNSFFYKFIPKALGSDGIAQNEGATIPASGIVAGTPAWATASTT